MRCSTVYNVSNRLSKLFLVLAGASLMTLSQMEIVSANESARIDICSSLMSGEGGEDLSKIYLSLLGEVRKVSPKDWPFILETVLNSDTAINPLSGEVVQMSGYFRSFEWLVDQDFGWALVQNGTQKWQTELSDERVREDADIKNTRRFAFPQMRLGPVHSIKFSPSGQMGPRYYRQPAWIEINGESFLIFNDTERRLIAMNVLSGEIRVVRKHKRRVTQVTTFEYQGGYYAIYGLSSRYFQDEVLEAGVQVTDLITGESVHFWSRVNTDLPPRRIGFSESGRPRFILLDQANRHGKKFIELTFGSEEVVGRKAVKEVSSEGILLQYLSSGKDEYILVKNGKRTYFVFSYPDLEIVASYEEEFSFHYYTEDRFDLNAPTLYFDGAGTVRVAIGAPVRADLEIAGVGTLEEIEVGTRIEPGLPLVWASEVSPSRLGSVSQPPILLNGGRKLTVLSKAFFQDRESYDVLYVVDLYSNEVISKVRLDGEKILERFAVRFIEVDGEPYLFFVSKDKDTRTILNLIPVSKSEGMHRFDFEVSETKDTDFSVIPTQEGLLVIVNRRNFGTRSIFLTKEVR